LKPEKFDVATIEPSGTTGVVPLLVFFYWSVFFISFSVFFMAI